MGARPLRVIHVVPSPVGAPWMIALLREQKRRGHDVAAILPSADGTIAAELEAYGIPTHVAAVDILFAGSTVLQKILTLWRLVRLLRALRPDVVHSHIVNCVVTMRLASWIADVPMHFGGNVHPYSMESDLVRPIEVGTAFCDAATIASCRYTRELMLRHGIPEEQIALIYYAVDQSRHDPSIANGSRFREELGIAAGVPVIGMVAYFYPPPPANVAQLLARSPGRGIKGHEVLIQAAPHVLQKFPDAKIVLVGRGWGPRGADYERQLKDLARRVDPGGSILFPGERSDVPDVLAAFDISVHCSLSDNLAGTVESLLLAKPMIVSDIPGFADTILHEKTGLVVPVDDPPALAVAIERLLGDGALARRLGEEGRLHALSRFTLARFAEDVELLMDEKRRRLTRPHYSLMVSIARATALPLRLAPVAIHAIRAMRRHGFSVTLFFLLRLRAAAGRCRAAIRSFRVRASDPA